MNATIWKNSPRNCASAQITIKRSAVGAVLTWRGNLLLTGTPSTDNVRTLLASKVPGSALWAVTERSRRKNADGSTTLTFDGIAC